MIFSREFNNLCEKFINYKNELVEILKIAILFKKIIE